MQKNIILSDQRFSDEELGLESMVNELRLTTVGNCTFRTLEETYDADNESERNMIRLNEVHEFTSMEARIGLKIFAPDTVIDVSGQMITVRCAGHIDRSLSIREFVDAYVSGHYARCIRGRMPSKFETPALYVCLRHFESLVGEVPYAAWLRRKERFLFSCYKQRYHSLSNNVATKILSSDVKLYTVSEGVKCVAPLRDSVGKVVESAVVPYPKRKTYDQIIAEIKESFMSKYKLQDRTINTNSGWFSVVDNQSVLRPELTVPQTYEVTVADHNDATIIDVINEAVPDLMSHGVSIEGRTYIPQDNGYIMSGTPAPNDSDSMVESVVRSVARRYQHINEEKVVTIVKERCHRIKEKPNPNMTVKSNLDPFTKILKVVIEDLPINRDDTILITETAVSAPHSESNSVWFKYTLASEYYICGEYFIDSVSYHDQIYPQEPSFYTSSQVVIWLTRMETMINVLLFKYKKRRYYDFMDNEELIRK